MPADLYLSAPNATKAAYILRTRNIPCPIRQNTDQYFLGRVMIRSRTISKPNITVSEEY